jgi:hypothetical protein
MTHDRKETFMSQRKNKSIAAAVAFTALLLASAAGCYYDRDDDWGYNRYTTIVAIAGTTPAHLAIAMIRNAND